MVYAPLTRCRAINNVPVKETALYYGQVWLLHWPCAGAGCAQAC